MSAEQPRPPSSVGVKVIHVGIDALVQLYCWTLDGVLALMTVFVALCIVLGLCFFMMLFVLLLSVSALQAAVPALQTAFIKHSRDSSMMVWTSINEKILDGLEQCMRMLNGRRRLRSNGASRLFLQLDEHGTPVPPHEFLCPLTHDIMSDPVTLLTGMTYDRHSIKNWIELGHPTCPMTQRPLQWRMNNQVFGVRNYAVRHLIDAWVSENLPAADPREPLGTEARDAVVLFEPAQSQPQNQNQAQAHPPSSHHGHRSAAAAQAAAPHTHGRTFANAHPHARPAIGGAAGSRIPAAPAHARA